MKPLPLIGVLGCCWYEESLSSSPCCVKRKGKDGEVVLAHNDGLNDIVILARVYVSSFKMVNLNAVTRVQ